MGERREIEIEASEGDVATSPAVSALRPRAIPVRPRVLVIDDDLLVRSMMERALYRFGFDVVTADGGRSAIARFRTESPAIDVVLLDLTMPDLSGEETFAALIEIDPGAKVIMSSGAGLARASLPSGISGFVQKPCLPSQLAEVLHRVLEVDPDHGQ